MLDTYRGQRHGARAHKERKAVMARKVLTLAELGEQTCRTVVQQAIGIPDAKMRSDFLEEKIAVLLFAQPSLPERLCVTAAVRQMGGATIYQDDSYKIWDREFDTYQSSLMPIFSCYMDCLYIYGIQLAALEGNENVPLPVINAGSPDAHPAHALADIACMQRAARYLSNVEIAWLGCDNGTLHSLVAATKYFPLTLRVAMPASVDPAPLMALVEQHSGGKGQTLLVDSKDDAINDASFVFAGCRGDMSDQEVEDWLLGPDVMAKASPKAKILLGARPFNAIVVAPELLASQASLLVSQSECRLRVHKRLLHWVFEDQA